MNHEVFPNSRLYDTGYCVLFVKDVEPDALLSRIIESNATPLLINRDEAEAIKALGEEIEAEDVPGLDVEELETTGMLDNSGPLLRAGAYQGWSFVIESEGSYLAGDAVLKLASAGAIAYCARLSATGASWISYAENSEILSSFDPLFVDRDYGKQPEVLDRLTGHRAAVVSGDRAEAYENALRQIQERLGCLIPAGVDTGRLSAVRVPGQY
ncbi:DUF6461 domain-containing protein [Streptomyces rochei]|uniref:DUF6461 domain-containing protein n=1 Tax=Streptomyces rochei TaxID=1928 RepID=UPI00362EFE64